MEDTVNIPPPNEPRETSSKDLVRRVGKIASKVFLPTPLSGDWKLFTANHPIAGAAPLTASIMEVGSVIGAGISAFTNPEAVPYYASLYGLARASSLMYEAGLRAMTNKMKEAKAVIRGDE